jgi:hypothetical protein
MKKINILWDFRQTCLGIDSFSRVNKATLNLQKCMDILILISLIKIKPPHLLPIFYRWSATKNNSRK